MAKKPALGRGLEHLLNQNTSVDESQQSNENNVQLINIKELKPNPYQPRKKFDDGALDELANSIKEQGIFQPILVRKAIVGYEIIAGERRYRASKIAGLKEIPAVIYDYTDQKMMEIALIENIQREDLTIVEEAKSYKMIIENLGFTQEELGKKVGKSRPHISNTLRILALEDEVLDLIDDKSLTMGHVKVLVTIKDTNKVKQIVNSILKDGLSVRQTEEIAKAEKAPKTKKEKSKPNKVVPRNKRLENKIREKLDTMVKISGEDKGTIEITYNSEDDLGRILEQLDLI